MFTNHIIKYIPDTNPDCAKAGESIATQIRDIILATHPGLTASNEGSVIWISLYGNKIYKIEKYYEEVGLSGNIHVGGYVGNSCFCYSPSSYSEYKFTVYQTNDTILFKKGHMPSLEGFCLGLLRSTSGEWFYYMCPSSSTLLYSLYHFGAADKKCIFKPSTRKLLTLQGTAFANSSYLGLDVTYVPAVFKDSQGNNITFGSIKSVINTKLVSGHYTDGQNRFYCLEIDTPIMLMS